MLLAWYQPSLANPAQEPIRKELPTLPAGTELCVSLGVVFHLLGSGYTLTADASEEQVATSGIPMPGR